MLCAFFEKRMRGEEAKSGELMDALFGPFWTSVERFGKATTGRRRPGGAQHWRAHDEWRRNAELDGTADALALLEFRINRLCKLLTVCDCWPSNVGRHLAHWIDSHVHLALEVEKRRGGPTRDGTNESSPGARWLSLTDWRCVDPLDVVAMREAAVMPTRAATRNKECSRATFYRKIIDNVTACKNMGAILRSFATDQSRRKTTCAALVRCALGYDAHRANFALRMAAHAALAEGPSVACERAIEAVEKGGSTTVFVAVREFVVRTIAMDADASAHLARKPRWDAYAANVVHAAETVRVRTRDRRTNTEGARLVFEDAFIVSSSADDAMALTRVCKKVPGPFVRNVNRSIHVSEACKIVRRIRNRTNAKQFFGGGDTFDDSGGSIVESLRRASDRDAGASFDHGDLARVLRTEGSRRLFVEASLAMRLNADAFRAIVQRESTAADAEVGVPFSRDFGLVSDALELMRHYANVRTHALPESIAERQRDAVRRNFADRTCDDAEMFRRRGEILWCVGCKKVKNFVVSSDKKNTDNHIATGYTRVCHVGEDLVCDEKKTYPCCRALPLERATVLDASRSRCVHIFGTAYVVTTCCGKLATFGHVTCSSDEVFACQKCVTRRLAEASASRDKEGGGTRQRTCRFCSETVGKQKGSFTGTFTEEDGAERTHTFCKRHVRTFMRREFEPLDLAETLREIPKTLKAS